MAHCDASPLLTLNVGGTFFTTSKETLLKEPFSLLGLLAKNSIPSVQDAAGVHFLDRDPKHIQLILNWLRDGSCTLPASLEARQELLTEIRHYGLRSMETWIHSQDLASAISSPIKGAQTYSSPSSSPSLAALLHPVKGLSSPDAHSRSTFFPVAVPSKAGRAAGLLVPPGCSPVAWVSPSATDAAQMLVSQSKVNNLRAAFLNATSPPPQPALAPVHPLTLASATDDTKWTAKYLRTNEGIRQVVNTLLELAYMAPHPSLNVGRVAINISAGPCSHDRISSLVGGSVAQLRGKVQHVTVKGLSTGWSTEFPIHPESDITLFNKYNIAAFVQDNWFVLTAVFKDQFGIVLEEQGVGGRADACGAPRDQQLGFSPGQKPTCLSCRQHTLAVTLQKVV